MVYPQPPQQKPGVGFPLARIAAFFSLACGAVVELGICSNEGKGNSELGLLRKLWNILKPGDVLLTDRYMCAWTELVMLKQRGVDSVTRLHHLRRIDFRRGKPLGPGDHIIAWPKPRKPHSIDQETYDTLPDVLMVREMRVKVEQPGFRTRTIITRTIARCHRHSSGRRPPQSLGTSREKTQAKEIRSHVKPRHEIKRDSLKRLKENSVPFEGVS